MIMNKISKAIIEFKEFKDTIFDCNNYEKKF